MPFPVKISWGIWEWQRIWSKFMIQRQWTSSDLGKWVILLIDGNPIFDHLMKVMGVQDSMYVNVYSLVLDSHYQPSTSERDAIHLFIKFFYSRLQHTKCPKPFLKACNFSFGQMLSAGFLILENQALTDLTSSRLTACSKQASETHLPTFIFIYMIPIKHYNGTLFASHAPTWTSPQAPLEISCGYNPITTGLKWFAV